MAIDKYILKKTSGQVLARRNSQGILKNSNGPVFGMRARAARTQGVHERNHGSNDTDAVDAPVDINAQERPQQSQQEAEENAINAANSTDSDEIHEDHEDHEDSHAPEQEAEENEINATNTMEDFCKRFGMI